MQKKDNTKKSTTPTSSYDSYKLTDEQIKRAVLTFEFDLLSDDSADTKAGAFLALLRSFTYTTDDTERENMLLAAESILMPLTKACENAMTRLAIKSHQAIIREGGVQ
jgi:hypothetical protein